MGISIDRNYPYEESTKDSKGSNELELFSWSNERDLFYIFATILMLEERNIINNGWGLHLKRTSIISFGNIFIIPDVL